MKTLEKEIIQKKRKPAFTTPEQAHQAKLKKVNELLSKADLSGIYEIQNRKK